MNGREFLPVARQLAGSASEAHWRTAVGRAYYTVFLEAREALRRWGCSIPPREQAHRFVRLRFSFPADVTLKRIGDSLDQLGRWRNHADYELSPGKPFATSRASQMAVTLADDAVELLDQIDADPARRAAAVAAIQAAFP